MYQINYGTWRRTVPGDHYIIFSRLGSPGDFLLEHWWYLATDCTPRTLCNIHCLLLPANEVCEGYVFTRVYHSVPGGVSRPRPRVEVKESGQGGPGPHRGRSRPTPGGWCIPACTEAELPPADNYRCGRYASYWNAFLFTYEISL